jgi:uncharacterized membrane protein YheB (UPF0754 family)
LLVGLCSYLLLRIIELSKQNATMQSNITLVIQQGNITFYGLLGIRQILNERLTMPTIQLTENPEAVTIINSLLKDETERLKSFYFQNFPNLTPSEVEQIVNQFHISVSSLVKR